LNMRKTVKKIAALVAGTTMVGATIMGAMALDLSNYPAPFVTSGVFDGKIVVGSSAMTSDVVGAIDVAASLQAAATTTTEIDIPGAAGKATVTGDSFEFSTASDILGIGEYVGEVRTSLLDTDLDALKSGVMTTSKGSTPVKQYLKFEEAEGGVVVFDEDTDEDVLGDFLYYAEDDIIFEYNMDFPEGAESDNDADVLDDLEGEMITLLGAPYTIVEATVDGVEISLTMLGGQVADTLKDGETKTYTFGGEDYEVTAVFISEDGTAKLSVNGMLTSELEEGETEVLGDGEVTIGVQEVLTNQREGIVEFYLGAEKLVMVDTNYTDDDWEACDVEVAGETIDDCEQIISADDLAGDKIKINYIHYLLKANDDIYVPAGKGVKEKLEKPEGMLGANWDIKYLGLMKTGTTEIKFKPSGDKAYDLEFVNNRGQKYSFPLVIDEADTFLWGDDDNRVLWTEPGDSADPFVEGFFTIAKRDYFIVSDKDDNTDEKAITTVLRYKGISESANTITVEEVGVGETKWNYEGTAGTDATGTMTIAGSDHTFWVDTDGDAIAVDLDGTDELEDAATVNIMFKGEGYIEMPVQTFTANDTVNESLVAGEDFVLTTPKEQFDDQPGANEETTITVSGDDDAGDEAVSLAVAGAGETIGDPNADDWEYGLSTYGVYFKLYDPSGTNEAESLTIEYPLSQRGAQVFVTAGVIEVSEGSETSGGKITSTMLNPIGVGMAVLDTDAESSFGSKKMIVVGGPCVNTIAAKLMGNPVDCTAGFTPGKAIIKLFTAQNALLVAGYNAQDTVGACYVLGDYKDYDLAGTEVEVVVADLKNLVVNKVQ
jgi:hypothetical protein